MRHILLLIMSSRLQQTHASVMIQTKRKVNIHELIYSRLKSKQKMVSFQVSDKWREPSINSGELDSIRIVSSKAWKGKKYKTYHGFTDEHSSEPNFNLRYFRFQILNLADLMHLFLKCIRCIFSKQKNKFSQNLEPIPNEMFILNDQRVNRMHKTVKISAPQIVEENFVEWNWIGWFRKFRAERKHLSNTYIHLLSRSNINCRRWPIGCSVKCELECYRFFPYKIDMVQ